MSDSELLSTVEAARELQVDRSTVARWVQRGKITPAMTVPGYRGEHFFEPRTIEQMKKAS